MKSLLLFLTMIVLVFAVGCLLAGCQDSAVSRDVSKDEVQQSNARREEHIDNMNIPDAQKAKMKEHLGQPSGTR